MCDTTFEGTGSCGSNHCEVSGGGRELKFKNLLF